ncbi:unnamed protein product [Scytosiphon promiscuus]
MCGAFGKISSVFPLRCDPAPLSSVWKWVARRHSVLVDFRCVPISSVPETFRDGGKVKTVQTGTPSKGKGLLLTTDTIRIYHREKSVRTAPVLKDRYQQGGNRLKIKLAPGKLLGANFPVGGSFPVQTIPWTSHTQRFDQLSSLHLPPSHSPLFLAARYKAGQGQCRQQEDQTVDVLQRVKIWAPGKWEHRGWLVMMRARHRRSLLRTKKNWLPWPDLLWPKQRQLTASAAVGSTFQPGSGNQGTGAGTPALSELELAEAGRSDRNFAQAVTAVVEMEEEGLFRSIVTYI